MRTCQCQVPDITDMTFVNLRWC